MEVFDPIFKFITDSSRKLTHRAVTIILVILILLLIDNLFGFSFYYNNSHKISLAKEINIVLSDTTLSQSEKRSLLTLRRNILFHSSLKDFIWNLSSNTWKLYYTYNDINGQQRKAANPVLHFLSSSIVCIISIIAIIIVGIKSYLEEKKEWSIFADDLQTVVIKILGVSFVLIGPQ